MSWLGRITSMFFDNVGEMGELKRATRYPAEVRTPFEDPDIKSRLPDGYRVELVKNSQSTLRLGPPDYWATNEYNNLDVWDNSDSTSIEVVSRFGKVVAAVGWEFDPASGSETAYTIGTVVDEHLRRRGLAKALWRAMIRISGAPLIHGCAASDEGFTLLRSMREDFPNQVSFDGDSNYPVYKDLRRFQGKGRAA